MPSPPAQRWCRSLSLYLRPQALTVLILGIVAGQQYPLLFSTLQAWFGEAGISVKTITQLTWIGGLFSIKFLWAPIVDNVKIPFLHRRLGKRRSWLLLCECGIIIGLLGMGAHDPHTSLPALIGCSVVTAFFAATHDIALDAYRIELTSQADQQAALASTYTIGYRLGMLIGGAAALIIGDRFGWHHAYQLMALIVAAGIITVVLSAAPQEAANADDAVIRQVQTLEKKGIIGRSAGFLYRAVVQPLADFFVRYRLLSLWLLALICVYRLSDQAMGSLAMPLYQAAGFSAGEIGGVIKVFGVLMTLLGGITGSLLIARYGVYRLLVLGAVLVSITNLLFILVALDGTPATVHYVTPDNLLGHAAQAIIQILNTITHSLKQIGVPPIALLTATIAADNLAGGIAGTVVVSFFALLTSRHYTATQSALFTSMMALPGKCLGGFSGAVQSVYGYPVFFLISILLGLPAFLLALGVNYHAHRIEKYAAHRRT